MKSGFSRWRRRGMPSGANLFFVDGVLVPRLSQLWILKAVWWARVHSVRMQDSRGEPDLIHPLFSPQASSKRDYSPVPQLSCTIL